MKILSILSLFILLSCANKQNNNPKQPILIKEQNEKIVFNDSINTDEIQNIKQIPYIENCNDKIFWSLVRQKENIPELIQKLTDETVLKDVYVPNFGGEYTVADVSLSILNEKIKDIPIFDLIGKQLSEDCGYCTYWYFVRESSENRTQLRNKLKEWYEDNEDELIWINSNYSLTGDCNSPIKGHYERKK